MSTAHRVSSRAPFALVPVAHARSRRLSSALTSALTLALACAVPLSHAEAQLGRLKKAAEQAAKDAVGKKVDPAGATATKAGGDGSVEITTPRLESIIAALNTRLAQAQQIARGKALEAEFTPKKTAYEECLRKAAERMQATMTPPSAEGIEKMAELNVKATAYMQRYAAIIQDKSRQREVLLLQDSATALSMQGQALMLNANCGPTLFTPTAVIDYRVAMQAANAEGGQWAVDAAHRSGMATWQFGRIRERVALWALIQAGFAKPNEGKFSESEHAALSAHAKELSAMAPLFRDGAMTWVTWGDLKEW